MRQSAPRSSIERSGLTRHAADAPWYSGPQRMPGRTSGWQATEAGTKVIADCLAHPARAAIEASAVMATPCAGPEW